MQYYERGLLGEILSDRLAASSNTNPDVVYFLPVNPGAVRGYGNMGTCDGGTNLENHEKYQDSIYFRAVDDSALYVNLYIASTLNWADKGITVDQATTYPTDPAGTTTLTITGNATFALKLRVPYWVQKGFTVRINGVLQQVQATPGTYLTISRAWSSGDTIAIAMPFTLRTERALDQPQTQAMAYGPVPMVTLNSATSYLTGTFYPNLGLSGDMAKVLTPTGTAMQFTWGGRTVRPFYIADTSAYHVYFHRSEPEVVFGGLDSGVPNVTASNGTTLLDAVWAAAPFATKADFTRAVQNATTTFQNAGLITAQQSQQVTTAAAQAPLGP
jgi:DUF1680 family protein